MEQSGEHRIDVAFTGRPSSLPVVQSGDLPESPSGAARDSYDEPGRPVAITSSGSSPERDPQAVTAGHSDQNNVHERAASDARPPALPGCEENPSGTMTPSPAESSRSGPGTLPPSELSTCQACLTIAVLALLVAALCVATLRLLRSVDREFVHTYTPLPQAGGPAGKFDESPRDGKGAAAQNG
ncbi:hypothetical protein HPB51_002829 [Rhipicephalus microplus]|uniref:Uncharacterized protein n=1 Tax=Rhipicephalus microplus TaxID=6941 RepID=A0A9J6EX14_RHIMP|nr:hypothetical protein HPB51_002829 [Rhipicephalus microplus]